MKRLFLIIGNPQSGKTTFGNLLAEHTGGSCRDTSAAILQKYTELSGHKLTAKEKESHRGELIQIGNIMCSRNPARLVELILANSQQPAANSREGINKNCQMSATRCPLIICGIRRKAEFTAAKALASLNGYTVITIRVSRPLVNLRDNFELSDTPTDYHIENCSTLDFLKTKAKEIAAAV